MSGNALSPMRVSLQGTFASTHPWLSTKRAPSPTLPSIRDDGRESDDSELSGDAGSTFSATPGCTISGEEPWMATSQEDASGANSDHRSSSFVEQAIASPVSLYTTSSTLGGALAASLSFSAYPAGAGAVDPHSQHLHGHPQQHPSDGSPTSPTALSETAAYSPTGLLPDLRGSVDSSTGRLQHQTALDSILHPLHDHRHHPSSHQPPSQLLSHQHESPRQSISLLQLPPTRVSNGGASAGSPPSGGLPSAGGAAGRAPQLAQSPASSGFKALPLRLANLAAEGAAAVAAAAASGGTYGEPAEQYEGGGGEGEDGADRPWAGASAGGLVPSSRGSTSPPVTAKRRGVTEPNLTVAVPSSFPSTSTSAFVAAAGTTPQAPSPPSSTSGQRPRNRSLGRSHSVGTPGVALMPTSSKHVLALRSPGSETTPGVVAGGTSRRPPASSSPSDPDSGSLAVHGGALLQAPAQPQPLLPQPPGPGRPKGASQPLPRPLPSSPEVSPKGRQGWGVPPSSSSGAAASGGSSGPQVPSAGLLNRPRGLPAPMVPLVPFSVGGGMAGTAVAPLAMGIAGVGMGVSLGVVGGIGGLGTLQAGRSLSPTHAASAAGQPLQQQQQQQQQQPNRAAAGRGGAGSGNSGARGGVAAAAASVIAAAAASKPAGQAPGHQQGQGQQPQGSQSQPARRPQPNEEAAQGSESASRQESIEQPLQDSPESQSPLQSQAHPRTQARVLQPQETSQSGELPQPLQTPPQQAPQEPQKPPQQAPQEPQKPQSRSSSQASSPSRRQNAGPGAEPPSPPKLLPPSPPQQQQQQGARRQPQRQPSSAPNSLRSIVGAVSEPLMRLTERGLSTTSTSPPSASVAGTAVGSGGVSSSSGGGGDLLPSPTSRQLRMGGGGAAGAAAAAAALRVPRVGPPPAQCVGPYGTGPVRILGPSGRQGVPLPELLSAGQAALGSEAIRQSYGNGAGAAAAVAALGDMGILGPDMATGPSLGVEVRAEVPSAPEVVARPPKWLKPSAFQVTEQLRSGRLQDLADKIASINCPTFLDLGGLEFSGVFTSPVLAPADGPSQTHSFSGDFPQPGGGAGMGSDSAGHRTVRLSLSGIGTVSKGGRRHRSTEPNLGAAAALPQVISVPPGQHITLYNATLLLTAEQYILVGPGASLTLKGVEILGCSREAARTTAAARRRAAMAAAAAAAAAAGGGGGNGAAGGAPVGPNGTQPQQQQQSGTGPAASGGGGGGAAAGGATAGSWSSAASAAGSLTPGPPSVASSGPRALRRTSSPGRTEFAAGFGGGGVRRSSVSGGDGGGLGLPPVRRRLSSNAVTVPYTTPNLIAGQSAGVFAVTEIVDPTEYVEDHGLIEVVGGYVRASNCRIWPGRVQLALCVSDGGAGVLSYSTAGPCCAAGAKSALSSEHTSYDGGAAGCVSALYGARVGLSFCQLRYGEGAATEGGFDIGLEARGSGTLAVLNDCEVVHCGVSVSLGARVHLQSSRVNDARAHGLYACDPGTTVYGKDCRIDDSGGGAAVVSDGAALRLSDSTLAGNAGPGLLVLPAAPSTVPAGFGGGGGSSHAAGGGGGGAAAPARSSATLVRCDVSANAGNGLQITGGSLVTVSECVVYNNLGSGFVAEGHGTALTAAGTRLIRNEAHGVRVFDGAGAVLTRCCAMGNGRDGMSVEGHGSRGQLARCECRENRESGLCVTGSARLQLAYTRLAANQHDGLAVGGDGSLAVAHNCIINGNVAKGAVVCMGGAAELVECAVHCNGSKSAQVSDEDSQLVLGRGCSLDRKPAAVNGGQLVQQHGHGH